MDCQKFWIGLTMMADSRHNPVTDEDLKNNPDSCHHCRSLDAAYAGPNHEILCRFCKALLGGHGEPEEDAEK